MSERERRNLGEDECGGRELHGVCKGPSDKERETERVNYEFTFQYPVLRLPIRSRYPDFFRNAISRLIVPSDNPVFSHILSLLRLLSSANICKINSCLSVNFIGPFIGPFIGSFIGSG